MNTPDPIIIRDTRLNIGLSVTECANLVHIDRGSWHRCELELDAPRFRNMGTGIWELFLLKTARPDLAIADLKQPTPAAIKKTRIKAGLSQSDAAGLVGVKLRNWQYYEVTDKTAAKRQKIPLALWELFLIKTRQL